MNAVECVHVVAQNTDEVILFHSATGKDSIVLLDLLSKKFKRVVCCFMYILKDGTFEQKYISWAKQKYPNCEFLQVPHFVTSEFIKYGLYGVKKNPKQKKYKLSDMMDLARKETGVEWLCLGFKKYDSLERRIMLNDLGDPINQKSKTFFPLADWSNKQCLAYIAKNKLAKPVQFNKDRTQGFVIDSGAFLLWLKERYPKDLANLFKQYPLAKAYLYEAEQAREAERSLQTVGNGRN